MAMANGEEIGSGDEAAKPDHSQILDRLQWAEERLQELGRVNLHHADAVGDPLRARELEERQRQATYLALEVVHNSRAALDNLVWALVQLNGRTPGGGNNYPVFSEDTNITEEFIFDRHLHGVACEHQQIIRSTQPYAWRGGAETSPLRRLNQLWNWDKHRLLNVVKTKVGSIDLKLGSIESFGLVYAGYPNGWLIQDLRTVLAAALVIVNGFEPAFRGHTVDFELTPETLDVEGRALWLRDPIGLATRDWRIFQDWLATSFEIARPDDPRPEFAIHAFSRAIDLKRRLPTYELTLDPIVEHMSTWLATYWDQEIEPWTNPTNAKSGQH